MTAGAGLFEIGLAEPAVTEAAAENQPGGVSYPSSVWDPGQFAQEQIARLVRQVFCPGRKNSARQVVFSTVDAGTESDVLALDVARVLAGQVQASVCVVEGSNGETNWARQTFDRPVVEDWCFGQLRSLCRPLTNNLWLLPHDFFWAEPTDDGTLRNRFGELRLEFDYTVLSSPPVGIKGQASVLGSAADGVVLLVEANVTRRAAAQKAKELIQNSNARLLGVVLTDRTFPIPESLYRRL